jgi:RNA polymerase sigma factor (sigma-70 family)
MADDSDDDLFDRAAEGDERAFANLVRRYQERLFNTVYRLLGNEADAQDVVQETFIKAYQSLNECRGRSQFFTWLYRIAYNAAIKQKKKRRGGDPSVPRDRAEDKRRIKEALERLGDSRQVDAQLIAEALGGNDQAFGALMSRYRDRLCEIIDELLDNPRERMAFRVQIFFQIRESLGHYRDDKPFVSWLHEVAKEAVEEFKRDRE